MNSSTQPCALRARYIFPVEGPPLPDGVVCFEGGRIVSVGTFASTALPHGVSLLDLGNTAILPGLVNAHTHLEFSDLSAPLGEPGMRFPDWIRRVIDLRKEGPRGGVEDNIRAVTKGLCESLRSGTTALGEIATPFWSTEPFERSPVDATVFHELIGLASDRTNEELGKARKHLSLDSSGRSWRAGISPHAPYSVHPELFAKLIAEARNSDASVAFHLAESREELQLLHEGTGPFRELLTDLGAWDPSAIPGGTRPLDYLRRLADAPRSLIIHGNYLDDEEIALLAAHAETMSLIYCPRTHAYFGHDRYPMEKLLDAGASVALGTDSRASNPDLSVLAEMRHMARQGAVPLSTVLRLGTMNGAKALGQDHETGSLSPGKIADFCIVALPDADAADPHELLLHDDSPSIATWRRGDVVWSVESI